MSRSGDEQRFSLGTARRAFAQPTGFQASVAGERSRGVGWAKRSVPNNENNRLLENGVFRRLPLGTALRAFAQPTGFQVIQASPLPRVAGRGPG